MKNTISSLILMLVISCSSGDLADVQFIDDSLIQNESMKSNVLYQSDSLYFTELELVNDTILAVIQHKGDNSIIFININTSSVAGQVGNYGNGPDDFISPSFVPNVSDVSDSYIYIHDINAKKMLKLNYESINTDLLLQAMDYPETISRSSGLTLSGDYFVGRKVEMDDESLFSLYDYKADNLYTAKQYIQTYNDLNQKNYFLSANVSMNSFQNSIVVGMYFIDLIQFYDLSGRLNKSITFTQKNFMPEVDSKAQILDLSKGYNGITRIYPTYKSCFLRRDEIVPISINGEIVEKKTSSIIKTDWQGDVLKKYNTRDDLIGSFCVDKSEERLFAIRTRIEGDKELIEIVSYELK